MKKNILTLTLCVLAVVSVFLIEPKECYGSDLFKITLNNNPNSVFYFDSSATMAKNIAGPVVLDDKLMFYSTNRVIVYSLHGEIIDTIDLREESKYDSLFFMTLYDNKTFIFAKKNSTDSIPYTLFMRTIGHNKLKKLKPKSPLYPLLRNYRNNFFTNLILNVVTNNMAKEKQLKPNLIGFSNILNGYKAWTTDRYYSITSPSLIINDNGSITLFPGIDLNGSSKNQMLVTPVAFVKKDHSWELYGVYSTIGTVDKKYDQYLFRYDVAGNVISRDTILKQLNEETIIGEDSSTYYTANKMRKYVFQPSVSPSGEVYYGTFDKKDITISINKITYGKFTSAKTEEDFSFLFDNEELYSFKRVEEKFLNGNTGNKTIPNIYKKQPNGEKIKQKVSDLSVEKYITRISKKRYQHLIKKFSRRNNTLPKNIENFKDSTYNTNEFGISYNIELSGPKGMIRSFSYPFGITVLSTRVLALLENGDILVRVDCKNMAEILEFTPGGNLSGRFIFNRKSYTERKDLVVTNGKRILEKDFEKNKSPVFYEWSIN